MDDVLGLNPRTEKEKGKEEKKEMLLGEGQKVSVSVCLSRVHVG